MSAPDPPPGLRARKKIKTRAAIRREAIRLIEEQGYANTTVEQIAAAADVSASTFFRYFRTKEAVLLSGDDQIDPIIDAFVAAPADLPPVAAYRYAVNSVFGAMTVAEREDAIAGQKLMYTVPEARGLLYSEYVRLIGLITDALAHRPGAPVDYFERRVIAGAIVGVLIAASDNRPMPDDALSRGLQVLDATMRAGPDGERT